jgi:hypothetical protein
MAIYSERFMQGWEYGRFSVLYRLHKYVRPESHQHPMLTARSHSLRFFDCPLPQSIHQ